MQRKQASRPLSERGRTSRPKAWTGYVCGEGKARSLLDVFLRLTGLHPQFLYEMGVGYMMRTLASTMGYGVGKQMLEIRWDAATKTITITVSKGRCSILDILPFSVHVYPSIALQAASWRRGPNL